MISKPPRRDSDRDGDRRAHEGRDGDRRAHEGRDGDRRAHEGRDGDGSNGVFGRPTGVARGQSTALDYTIALAVTLLVVVGLVTAASGFVEDRRSNVVETELRVVGQHLAAEITAADRLVQSGDTQTVVLNRSLPGQVTGTEYTIEIEDAGSHHEIVLSTEDPAESVTVEVRTTTDVAETGIEGGDVAVVYDPSTDQLEVRP